MRYQPNFATPAEWQRVRGFVTDAVADYQPENRDIARQLLSSVTAFVIWAVHEKYAPLNVEDIFDEGLIVPFLRSHYPSPASRDVVQSRLMRVARVATGIDGRRRNFGRNPVLRPYTEADLARVVAWASYRPTAEQRIDAAVGLALAGGAGLRVGELLEVRGSDLTRTPDGDVVVTVRGRTPRRLPVRRDWAWLLDSAAHRIGTEQPVLFPANTTLAGRQQRVHKVFHSSSEQPDFQRLRDTWVLDLAARLPLGDLMHVAGIPDVTPLSRYLPHLPAPDPAALHTVLADAPAVTR